MLTGLPEEFLKTPDGLEADRILRSCVHCGFCTANCPTYRLLGDELDSPRGRIYLIKNLLEGNETTRMTLQHLDRCLTCRSCETYCPSGVEYGHLLDIGRINIESRVTRTIFDKLTRFIFRQLFPYRKRFGMALALARISRPVMPRKLKNMIPVKNNYFDYRSGIHDRKVILFSGCVQPSISPEINVSAGKVLDKLGITAMTIKEEGCCGAIDYHMAAGESAKQFIKNNIDCWWPYVEKNVEAIITTASGCGVMIKEYGYILRNDPDYAAKAEKISALARDIVEVTDDEMTASFVNDFNAGDQTIAFHSPCTLQHGQKLNGVTESLLSRLGFNLVAVKDSQICCGSAGIYSLLQSELSGQLGKQKISSLQAQGPDEIITANIGCQLQLQQAASVRVRHWIDLLADRL